MQEIGVEPINKGTAGGPGPGRKLSFVTTAVAYPAVLLTVAIGIHVAVVFLLVAKYVETRFGYVGWWTAGAAALTAGVVTEMWIVPAVSMPPLLAVQSALLLAGAGFFLTGSVARDPRAHGIILAGFLGFGALVFAAVIILLFGRRDTEAARLVAGLAAGAAFLLAAEGYRRGEQVLDDLATRTIFAGLIAIGVNFIGWAWVPRTPQVIAGSEFLAGLCVLLFGAGIELRSLQRSRQLVLLSRISSALQRAQRPEEILRDVLQLAGGLLQVHTGWVFLRDPKNGSFQLSAAYQLPGHLSSEDHGPMRGSCRCLDLLQTNQLTGPVNIVECLRLQRVGIAAQHASVPLRSSTGIIGLMNLVLPGGHPFSQREMALLSTIGGEIGLAIEKARLLDELREKERVRSFLIKKLLTAQEDEQRRIARELHDETGQSLTALILNLQRARMLAEQRHPGLEGEFERLQRLAESTLDEVRKLIYDLRPTVLDDLGLAAALRWYVHNQIAPRGLTPHIATRLGEERLDPVLETTLFRIAQEALWNVVKHAEATRVDVELARDGSRVSLRVHDNGHGFRADGSRPVDTLHGGFGLGGMQERAALLGGTVRIASAPDTGTEVLVEFPLPAPSPA